MAVEEPVDPGGSAAERAGEGLHRHAVCHQVAASGREGPAFLSPGLAVAGPAPRGRRAGLIQRAQRVDSLSVGARRVDRRG